MQNDELDKYLNAMLEKSEEAYLLALEIINKPTIKYRTEGFCFFICNAWELLLKAYLIKSKGEDAIKYKDKTSRTIGLDDCIVKVFTSENNPTRNNLFFIKRIRNLSTHSILPSLDFEFVSVFQRCLYNYNEFFMKQFPNYEINKSITPFVSLSKIKRENEQPIILDKANKEELEKLISEASLDGNLSLNIRLYSTKKENEADLTFKISNNATENATFINVPKDTNSLYPYPSYECAKKVKETISLELGESVKFSKTDFQKICKDKNIDNDIKYCYKTIYYNNEIKKYSDEAVEYVSAIYIEKHKKMRIN